MSDYLKSQIGQIDAKIEEAKALASDPSIAQLAEEEIAQLEKQKSDKSKALESDQNQETDLNTGNNLILEIRAAAGGDDRPATGASRLQQRGPLARMPVHPDRRGGPVRDAPGALSSQGDGGVGA